MIMDLVDDVTDTAVDTNQTLGLKHHWMSCICHWSCITADPISAVQSLEG